MKILALSVALLAQFVTSTAPSGPPGLPPAPPGPPPGRPQAGRFLFVDTFPDGKKVFQMPPSVLGKETAMLIQKYPTDLILDVQLKQDLTGAFVHWNLPSCSAAIAEADSVPFVSEGGATYVIYQYMNFVSLFKSFDSEGKYYKDPLVRSTNYTSTNPEKSFWYIIGKGTDEEVNKMNGGWLYSFLQGGVATKVYDLVPDETDAGCSKTSGYLVEMKVNDNDEGLKYISDHLTTTSVVSFPTSKFGPFGVPLQRGVRTGPPPGGPPGGPPGPPPPPPPATEEPTTGRTEYPTESPPPTFNPTIAPLTCEDTAGWRNPFGKTCGYYEQKGYCKDGTITAGTGQPRNFPELNCCACGKQQEIRLPQEECKDTPHWSNGMSKNCQWYEDNGKCSGGAISDTGTGASRNYPEDNCCACGKQARGGCVARCKWAAFNPRLRAGYCAKSYCAGCEYCR